MEFGIEKQQQQLGRNGHAQCLPDVERRRCRADCAQARAGFRFRVTIKGQTFTARDAIEKYLFYRAAMLALEQRSPWFTLVEGRSPGDTPPPPQADPSGYHYSFRMAYWRPVWRYKRTGSAAWSTWSLFSGGAFFADGKDPKAVSDYEVSADIVMQKGPMDDRNPIAFEPRAVSEFLVNQVNPPE